jgi:DNA-binding response OmpR family regulator
MPADRTGTVLVVEDDPHVCLLLERLVAGAGWATCTAASSPGALELRPGMRVVYSSGHPRAAAALDELPACDGFLLKPYKAADLERVLDRAFACE